MRIVRALDRYIFAEFFKIFLATAIGFPLLVIIIDLTDNLQKYLDRNLPRANVALSYVYLLPESTFQVLPAAVLFATVFSIGSLTRHSEITAAKASGISFYRLVMPIMFGALLATGVDMVLSEVVPVTTSKRNELLEEQRFKSGTTRFNFAYAADEGRVYKVRMLDVQKGGMEALQVERKGVGPTYPTYVLSADSAIYFPGRGWRVQKGVLQVIVDSTRVFALQYQQMVDRLMTEKPADLLARQRPPQEMRYRELQRYIAANERAGVDMGENRVELALKIAIPFTCLIIALFGAPLATSTQRGGAAYGIAISLATTVTFLVLIQLTKAIGAKGYMQPDLAAWTPSIVFGTMGLILMARVRT